MIRIEFPEPDVYYDLYPLTGYTPGQSLILTSVSSYTLEVSNSGAPSFANSFILTP